MYTAENAPGVAVLLSGDADVPGPLTGLPTHQDNLDTVIGRYSRLIVVGADADLGGGTDSAVAHRPARRRGGLCAAPAQPRDPGLPLAGRAPGGAARPVWRRSAGAANP